MQNSTLVFHNCARPWLVAVIMAAVLLSGPIQAETASGAWQSAEEAAARLVAAQDRLDANGRIWLGIHIKLAPGWKTYWRNPGESGAPPRFDWSASGNVGAVEVRWPAPQRFSAYGFDSFGYHDQIVLPVLLHAAAPSQPVTARLKLDYMICAQICIPMQAELALDLPADDTGAKAEPSPFAPLIQHYLDLVPQPAAKAGMTIESAVVSGPPGEQVLHIKGHSERPFVAPDLMVEGPGPFGFGRPKLTYGAGRHQVILALPVYAGTGKAALTTQALTVTLVDGRRAVERRLNLGR